MAFGAIVVALLLAASAGGLWLQLTKTRQASKAYLLSHASFEQSPQATILLEVATLQVVTANQAFLTESGYSAEELSHIPITQLFGEEVSRENLQAQLSEPVQRAALKMR